jgi:hypothetical protein
MDDDDKRLVRLLAALAETIVNMTDEEISEELMAGGTVELQAITERFRALIDAALKRNTEH